MDVFISTANFSSKLQKDQGLAVDEEALWKAHRMAEQRVGHGSLRQLEGAAAAGIGEFLKVWSQKKD